jgi:hypothetical protein
LFALAAVVPDAIPVPLGLTLFCAVANSTNGIEFVGAGKY